MPRGRTNGRSGEYRHAAENFGCVRERFLHLHLLHQQKAGLSAHRRFSQQECCAMHEWPLWRAAPQHLAVAVKGRLGPKPSTRVPSVCGGDSLLTIERGCCARPVLMALFSDHRRMLVNAWSTRECYYGHSRFRAKALKSN
jgi:hypothetical protein